MSWECFLLAGHRLAAMLCCMSPTRVDADAPGPDARSQPTSGEPAARRRGPLLAEGVIAHLEELIFGGSLEPGDSLPSETELAAELGVSRLTVRECIRSLQARGLVSVSHGRRPVVAPPNATPLADFFSAAVRRDAGGLLELLEVRLAIEVHTAQLAARHATTADLRNLVGALEAMREAGDDEDAFNRADVRFHAAIAAGSGNQMLGLLVEGMEGPLHSSRMQSRRGFVARSGALTALLQAHEDIYARIDARDAAGATASMRRHLLNTRKDLRAALSLGDSAGSSNTP